MLDSIRRLVYKMGFRPKPGTVLYSPSIHYRLAFEDAWKHFHWGMAQVISENTRLVRVVVNECEICKTPDNKKPMAFRRERWCSENHRKKIQGDNPVKKY